ncbi:MAG: L-threonylcarbamoyladenylate synthase [Saprospiraceae bacterium]
MAFLGTSTSIAAELLTKGNLVGIPTETVYGLAGNAFDPMAVSKIFQIKSRPSFDPLIVHVSDRDEIRYITEYIPSELKELVDSYMPGPLTIIAKKRQLIPDIVTAGSPYVGIRIPNHPLTLELLNKLDFPLAAPSANPFGYISPTTAQHVADQLGSKVSYILDGGPCQVGVESTIIKVNNDGSLQILRKGGLTIEQIAHISGKKLEINDFSSSNPQAPGMLSNHYAPRVPLNICDLKKTIQNVDLKRTGIISFSEFYEDVLPNHCITLSKSGDFGEAARNLFAGMRHLDNCDIDQILVELVPDTDLGFAINDRLKRAASNNI